MGGQCSEQGGGQWSTQAGVCVRGMEWRGCVKGCAAINDSWDLDHTPPTGHETKGLWCRFT